MNLLEGANVTITVSDNASDDMLDVTLAAAAASGVTDHSQLTGVTATQHHSNANDHANTLDHAQSHTHASHTSVGADDHHATSHTDSQHTDGPNSKTSHTHTHAATTGQTVNDHHNQAHVLAGGDHTASGLTTGNVPRATGTTTFAWQQLAYTDLSGTPAFATPVVTTPLALPAAGAAATLPRSDHAHQSPGAIAAITAEVNLNTSITETTITTATLPTSFLFAGTTFRVTLRGTVQVQATSGILTFRVYLGANVSTETCVMATQTGAAGPVGFFLDTTATVRSTGASGTYVSHGWGQINFAVPAILTTTTATTATVDTTAATPVVKATAQWATSSATNILKVETATIEVLKM